MSRNKIEACGCVLRESFNEIVEKVGKYLAEKGPSELSTIARSVEIKEPEVQTALRFLIKNNMVTFDLDASKTFVLYSVNLANILAVIRSDRYANAIKSLYGLDAELIVRQLFINGQMTLPEIISSVLEICVDRSNGEKRIYEKFVQLAQTHFVQQCPVLVASTSEVVLIPEFKSSESKKYCVPPLSNVSEELHASTQSTEDPTEAGSNPKSDVTYWCLNISRFNDYLRDQTIIRAVASRVGPQAAEIVRALLRRSEVKSPEGVPKTVPISFYEISEELPKDINITNEALEKWLKVLTEAMPQFVQLEGMGGGGQYSVHFQKGFTELCKAHIESVVQERYGSESKRIVRILMMKNVLEMPQIEQIAKIDPREAKANVYKLLGDNFVSNIELHRTADFAPKFTNYFLHVDVNGVAKMLLDRCYKTLTNLIIRRMHEMKEKKRVNDKEQRILAILSQIPDLESLERDELKKQLTKSDRAQLIKFNHATYLLLKAEQEVDETIFVLESHLGYVSSV